MAAENSIMVIAPYWYSGTWVFDDSRAGLEREPFVAGIPEMIDEMVAGIPGAQSGFRLLFSAAPFPGCVVQLDWVREESGGNWYRRHGREDEGEGWLCPALFKYFETAPPSIYCKAEPLRGERQ